MLEYNYKKISKDLKQKYNSMEITDLIIISYELSNRKEMEKYINEIHKNIDIAVLTTIDIYGLFVRFLYEEYMASRYTGIYNFLDDKLIYYIEEFKNEYFKEA